MVFVKKKSKVTKDWWNEQKRISTSSLPSYITDDHSYSRPSHKLQPDDPPLIDAVEEDDPPLLIDVVEETVITSGKTGIEWDEGRRIIELKVLAEGLAGCKNCSTPLQLHLTEKETKKGFGSILHIRCATCKNVNQVPTGKRREEGRRIVWDVNTKAASGRYRGIIHALLEI